MKVPGIILILLLASCNTTKKATSRPVNAVIETTSKPSKGGLTDPVSYMEQQTIRIKHDVHGARVERAIEGIDITFDELGNGENFQLFIPGTSTLTSKGRESLNNLIKILLDFPDTWLRIESFTDDIGPAGFNMALTQRRAYSIANYLSQNKIPYHRLMIRWYGETRHKVKNVNAVARAENRRIEIMVTASVELKASLKK